MSQITISNTPWDFSVLVPYLFLKGDLAAAGWVVIFGATLHVKLEKETAGGSTSSVCNEY
jgi:hypothetical protein